MSIVSGGPEVAVRADGSARPEGWLVERLGPQQEWTIDAVIERWATQAPDRVAMHDVHGDRATYAQLRDRVRGFAAGLRALGVGRGDRVALLMDNHVDYLVAWFAINALRAAQVPINTASRGASLEHVLANSQPKVAVVDAGYVDVLADACAPDQELAAVVVRGEGTSVAGAADTVPWDQVASAEPLTAATGCDHRDPAAIIYTSGTTGPAKGVVISQAHMHLFAGQITVRLELGEDDVFFVCLPLFHANAQFMQAYAALIGGGTIAIEERFSASRWLDRIRETGATASSLLGVMAQFVYKQPATGHDRDHRLTRMVTIPLPAAIARDFEERFGVECSEGYGMTEVCLVTLRPPGAPLRPGSCGKPLDDAFEVDLLDPQTNQPVPVGERGEFVVRPKLPYITFLEYNAMPEQTVEAWRHLWFHTGDLGRRDEDGYYYFLDRVHDRIRRRGENITAYDVESALLGHPHVLEAAVIGVPAEDGDDDIKAFVVVDDAERTSFLELIEHCVERLPYFSVPRYLEILNELPKTETGKVLKRTLRERLREGEWDREAFGIAVTRAGLRIAEGGR